MSESPSPHSCRNATLGLTTVSRLAERRHKPRLTARRRFSKEPNKPRYIGDGGHTAESVTGERDEARDLGA
uniref:Uncharacterized protein n=1 Tax=Triticum urartu TaxID=4572 RepID=A0A8R7TRC8_TRIUA